MRTTSIQELYPDENSTSSEVANISAVSVTTSIGLSETGSTSPKINKRSSKPRVSFADGSKEAMDSGVSDSDKSKEELLKDMTTLRHRLNKARKEYKEEKTLRRKKDQNLLKLAQQMGQQMKEIRLKDDEIERLKREFDLLKLQFESLKTAYVGVLKKSEDATGTSAASLDNLEVTVRDLRNELLLTKLDNDKLRFRLGVIKMHDNPNEADSIAFEVVNESLRSENIFADSKKKQMLFKQLVTVTVTLVTVALGCMSLNNYSSMQQLLSNIQHHACGPVSPFSVRSFSSSSPGEEKDEVYSEAPWFLPSSLKGFGRDNICFGRTHTSFSWSNGQLVIKDINTGAVLVKKKDVKSVALVKKKLLVKSTKNGNVLEIDAPWGITEGK